MRHQTEMTAQIDHSRVCNHVDCNKPPLVGREFCSGTCAAKTVDEFDEIAGDLYHFPGANISPEYREGYRITVPTK